MKEKITALILGVLMIINFAGCKQQEKTAIKPATTNPETKMNYAAKYDDTLAKIYEFIKYMDDETEPDEGFGGIWEAALALESEAISQIEYILKDINSDNIPELLIGVFAKEDYAYTNNEIYAIYALKNDAPVLILEGRSRSSYSLKDDGSLFYSGSNGAAHSIFGTYHISKDNEVVCDDYYFTYPDDNDPSIIEIYHNNTGIYDRDDSEKLDITLDDFWKLEEEKAKGTAKPDATSFAEADFS